MLALPLSGRAAVARARASAENADARAHWARCHYARDSLPRLPQCRNKACGLSISKGALRASRIVDANGMTMEQHYHPE